jgi:hypothetical protein
VGERPRRRHTLQRHGDSGRFGQPDGEGDGAFVALALEHDGRLLRGLIDHDRDDFDLLRAGRLRRHDVRPFRAMYARSGTPSTAKIDRMITPIRTLVFMPAPVPETVESV